MITHKLSIPDLKKEDERKVSDALHDVWGVRNIKINTQTNEAIISYDEDAGSLIDFEQAVKDLGYEVNKLEDDM
ncbi:heavy-metal-associated domain-containing protein [Oceanobacillus profundus]|uniref:heavy-metal-associated domain-containing protein n=1 Tax=Oceanobacillus TaxID=182709 RepID=UPI00203B0604|nr:heavy-metal-associated domain-containing protein [Oceanobacillus profundus]MCM3397952.1 cation transporter [Oceanobacillus profundus]MDO6448827.1 heavy-metal-associated domain-containing protein [Oceanobacillus profundus]